MPPRFLGKDVAITKPAKSASIHDISVPDPLKPGHYQDKILVNGVEIAWDTSRGTCAFRGIPVALMWVDSTLAGLMAGVAAMVGPERFNLALQSEGRNSVESDWLLISSFQDFREGFAALNLNAAVAGWGDWQILTYDPEKPMCVFRATNNWEGMYQKSLGVCWGSGMLAGKFSGICSKLFKTNCWATQTSFVAKGDAYDTFEVIPSARNIENEIEHLLKSDSATRADLAVAVEKLQETEKTLRQEIAERTRSEQALRQGEERHRTILDTAMDGFWLVDMEGRLLEVNQTYCRMSGYSAQELLTMCVGDLVPGETISDTAAHIQTIALLGEDRFESRQRRKDGSLFEVEVSAQYRPTDGGRIVVFVRDITARVHAEEERAGLQAQLQQAGKMESIGRLAGGVAHDFNNMLCVILAHTEFVLEEVDPSLQQDLLEIKAAAQRSANLTRQLLAFARKQIVAPKVLNLNETLAQMLVMLQRLIGEDIQLTWRPGAGLWPVLIDPSQVDQILANLCVNARDAISGVGHLTIETGNITLDEDYCASHLESVPGDYVRLVVSDDGCGMDKEARSHLFEPFFTTKILGKGTGLGLATVYGIVKQNHGLINVYSEPGSGTTFTVYLPRNVGNADLAGGADAPAPAHPRGRETILLVEDEVAILKVVARVLERLGYTVLAATSPGEAMRLGREHPGQIDLLLTDVVLPEMNGRELAQNLLALHPRLKRLLMSGYTADVIAQQGVLDEGVNFIEKPFTMQDLAAKVRGILDGKPAGQ